VVNIYFWATVSKTVRPMLSDRCLSCLSVSLLYCSQTVGWIKMKLGTRVGLGPGHIVLDGDLAPLPKKGAQPQIFGSCLLWPNGWMDQDARWYGGRPRLRRRCVRWGPSFTTERSTVAPPLFSTHVYCGHGRLSQLLLSSCYFLHFIHCFCLVCGK